jgi:hypothetical protein
MSRSGAFINGMALTRAALALVALGVAGCGGSSTWYEAPKSAPPRLEASPFVVSVSQVESKTCMEALPGAWNQWKCMGVHFTARNAGDHIAEFDPEDLVLSAPELGRKFHRANKAALDVDGKAAPGVRDWYYGNLALRNPLKPGASYSAVVWYDTSESTDQIRSLDVLYKDVPLHLGRH